MTTSRIYKIFVIDFSMFFKTFCTIFQYTWLSTKKWLYSACIFSTIHGGQFVLKFSAQAKYLNVLHTFSHKSWDYPLAFGTMLQSRFHTHLMSS